MQIDFEPLLPFLKALQRNPDSFSAQDDDSEEATPRPTNAGDNNDGASSQQQQQGQGAQRPAAQSTPTQKPTPAAGNTTPPAPASLQEQLKRDEGHRNTPDGRLDFYQDSEGNWTGGYGHNFDARGETPVVMTQQQADDQLDRDIAVARGDLARELPWTKDLDAVRREAL